MGPGFSKAGNNVVPVLFPELAVPLMWRQRRELKGSLASKPLVQGKELELCLSETAAVFIPVAFGAALAFEHGGSLNTEQYSRNRPFPGSIHLQTTSAKIN